jgi:hypothetical protein
MFEPSECTRPVISCPATLPAIAANSGESPRQMCRSDPQMPPMLTLTTTPSGSGTGTSNSRISYPLPGPSKTAALPVALIAPIAFHSHSSRLVWPDVYLSSH